MYNNIIVLATHEHVYNIILHDLYLGKKKSQCLLVSQSSEEAVAMAMAYFALFLPHISNVYLMREFLRFTVQGSYDGKSVMNVILYSVTSKNVKVC